MRLLGFKNRVYFFLAIVAGLLLLVYAIVHQKNQRTQPSWIGTITARLTLPIEQVVHLFVNKTQHLLFGYKGKLTMGNGRYAPTIMKYIPTQHSRKPENSYELIESISFQPMLELFARPPVRGGWDVWGNEVENSIEITS